MNDILIIGAGVLGKALGGVLTAAGAPVSYFGTVATQCPGGCASLEEVGPKSRFVLLCVPSWGMRGAVARVVPHLSPSAGVVSLAKGLEATAGASMYDVCTETLPAGQPFAVLGGALLAVELSRGLPGAGVLGCEQREAFGPFIELLQRTAVRLEWVRDARSVALAGVLKNVYALALGIADGLGLGANARGWLFSTAVSEMRLIGRRLHIDDAIMMGMAGVGDLVATGLSPDSKNRTAGFRIAQTGMTDIRCEGLVSLAPLRERLGTTIAVPLLETLDGIVTTHRNPRVEMERLMGYTGRV